MSDTPQPAPQSVSGAGPSLEPVLREIGAALRGGDMDRAFTLARETLDKGHQHPGLLSLRSLWFEQNDRFEEALIDLETALVLAAGDASTLNAKGLVLDKLQRPRDALVAFEAASQAQPPFAPAFHNLGWAREITGDAVGARFAYEQALALKPDYVEPLSHLARLAMRRGDANSARIHAEQTLRIDATQPTASVVLAEVDLVEGEPAVAEARLRAVLAREDVTPLDRGVAHKVLGDALDAQARYAEAFAAYAAGNDELKALYAPRLASGRGQSMPQMLTWLLQYMTDANPESWRRTYLPPADPDAPSTHVFIVGFPGSGSTFIENVFMRGANSVLLRDHDALSDAVRDFLADGQDMDHLLRLGDAEMEPYRRAYWRRVREAGVEPRGKLFIDRLPLNSVRAPVIAKLFPGAKMIFTLRDPRDVVLRAFRSRLQMTPVSYEYLTLQSAVQVYDLTMRLALINRQRLPLSLGLIRYEDVVKEPETQMLSVAGFLGVDLDGDMRAFTALESGRFANGDEVATGFYGETIGAWKNYRADLEPIAAMLEQWAAQFGYPAANP